MSYHNFASRHNGPDASRRKIMLQKIGAASLEKLITDIVPASILLKKNLALPPVQSEFEYLKELRKIASKNKTFKTYIGSGYYNCITPGVIQRNILENP